jgi:hypothetical protein
VLREKTGHAGPHFDGSGARYDSSGNYTGGDSLGGISGDWAYIRLPDKIQLHSVDLWARYDNIRNPIDATVLGSLNGTNWGVLGSWKNAKFTAGNSSSFTINSIQYYDYIGFVFEKIEANSSGGYVNFHEIELFGTPEYDPEAHGTDVTVKSYPNVLNTDWLEVYYDAKNYTSGVVQDETANDRDAEMNATFDNGTIKAFNFSGAYTSNVTTSDHGLGSGDVTYTMSYWFKRTAVAGSYDYVVMLGNGNTAKSSILMWINNNQLTLDHWSAALRVLDPIKLDTWYHVAAGHRGGVTPSLENDFIYINGKKVTPEITQTAAPFTLAGSKLTLGSEHNGTTEFLNGSIANFRLFNRALTSDEIYQLYAYQKEDFGHGDLSMTLKAGRLGIGTSEPRAALDVRGDIHAVGSVNPVIGMWKQTINSTTLATTILTNIGSCMSTRNADGYGGAFAQVGLSGQAGIFIAPYDGIYQFQAFLISQSTGSSCLLVFNANGPSVDNDTWNSKNLINSYNELFELRGAVDLEEPITFATLLNMSKGDYVDIQNHSSGYLGLNDLRCSAFLLHRFN